MAKNKLNSECPADKTFVTAKGEYLKSINELLNCVESMDDWTFKYHVNADNGKNDFMWWIKEVFKEEGLASKLDGVLEKGPYLEIIRLHFGNNKKKKRR